VVFYTHPIRRYATVLAVNRLLVQIDFSGTNSGFIAKPDRLRKYILKEVFYVF
jgi:hypothetical protein